MFAGALCLALASPAGAEDAAPVVTTRDLPESSVREVKAEGLIDAPPARILAVLADVDHYVGMMPGIERSKLLKRDGDTLWHYGLVDAPLVSKREFVLRIEMARRADGTHEMWWSADNALPSPREPDAVRLEVNNGRWRLEPRDGGTRTYASYTLHADLGGRIPAFLAERSNKQSVNDVFEAIRRAVNAPKYASAPSPLADAPKGQP